MSNFTTELIKNLSNNMSVEEIFRIELEKAFNQLLETELDCFLGYEKYSKDGYNTGDSRNGYYKRTFQTKYGELNLSIPRDRAGNFKQQTLPSHARSDDSLEQMVILMYSKGVTTREIAELIEKMYGHYYSRQTISTIMPSNENKYALACKTEIVTLNGEIITIDEDEPHKCLPSIQLHQKELCNKLWAMANALRGNMEAYEFKNYILGMIFYYYLSDRTEKYMVNLLKDDGISYEDAWKNEEYREAVIEESLRDLGFVIEPQFLFRNLVKMVENRSFDIEFLQKAINSLMESTIGRDSQGDFDGLFSDMQLDSTKLGHSVKDRSAVMSKINRMEYTGLTRSMSEKGCSPDNAACESFFGHLKNEMFYNRSWQGVSPKEFIAILNDYLIWYREKRIKLSLGGLSPIEYRRSLGLI